MAFTYPKLMDISTLPSSITLATSAATAVYANPVATTTYIKEIEIHNTNSATVNLILYNVPDASTSLGTPALSSQIIKLSLISNDTIWIEPAYPYVLTDQNDAIFGVATLSGVNIQVRGGKS